MNDQRAEDLESTREDVARLRNVVAGLEAGTPVPIVQELVLARRHLEDARMRLGVALAYHKGLDPWTNKVEDKEVNPMDVSDPGLESFTA